VGRPEWFEAHSTIPTKLRVQEALREDGWILYNKNLWKKNSDWDGWWWDKLNADAGDGRNFSEAWQALGISCTT
jgi:hypothetical protein